MQYTTRNEQIYNGIASVNCSFFSPFLSFYIYQFLFLLLDEVCMKCMLAMLLAWTKVTDFLSSRAVLLIVPWWRKSCQCYFYKNNITTTTTQHTHFIFVVCMNNLFFTEIREKNNFTKHSLMDLIVMYILFVQLYIYNCKLII